MVFEKACALTSPTAPEAAARALRSIVYLTLEVVKRAPNYKITEIILQNVKVTVDSAGKKSKSKVKIESRAPFMG